MTKELTISYKKIDSCITIFELMNLILDSDVTFGDIEKLFSKEKQKSELKSTTLYSVKLSKCINTLRLFGFNVSKEKGRYRLQNSPYKIDMTPQNLYAFELIKNFANSFKTIQDKALKNCDETQKRKVLKELAITNEFSKFIENLEFRFSDDAKVLQRYKASKKILDFGFYFASLEDKVCVCSNCCNEDYDIKISYYKNSKIITMLVKPIKLSYTTGAMRLEVLDTKSGDSFLIPIDKIIDIKQQPSKSKPFGSGKISVFGIRGRLSKNYTLREWEHSHGEENGWNIIVNTKEPEDELLKRLLKYADSCKIFNPKTLRQKYLEKIDKMLAIYQET